MVWRNPFDWAPVTNIGTRSARDVVGEGALRGRSPRTREGRIGPTAQKISGQWLVVRDGALPASELIADWTWLRCYPRYRKVHLNIGMHPFTFDRDWMTKEPGDHFVNSQDALLSRKPDYSTGPPVAA